MAGCLYSQEFKGADSGRTMEEKLLRDPWLSYSIGEPYDSPRCRPGHPFLYATTKSIYCLGFTCDLQGCRYNQQSPSGR